MNTSSFPASLANQQVSLLSVDARATCAGRTSSTTSPRPGVIKVGVFEDFPPFSSAARPRSREAMTSTSPMPSPTRSNVTPDLIGSPGRTASLPHRTQAQPAGERGRERRTQEGGGLHRALRALLHRRDRPQGLEVKDPADLPEVGRGQPRHAGRHLGHRVAPVDTDVQRFND